jgi:hypothetical protein
MTTNGQNEEELKELFERFVSAEEAEQAMEDIQKAEEILREQSAPEPNSELISDIKAEIAGALLRRKRSAFKRIAYKTAVAVAVVIFVAVISVELLERGGGEPKRFATASIIPAEIWESDDADLAILAAEIEQIEGRVLTLQLGENGANGDRDLIELEMRLIALDSDFWKE